MKKNLFQVAAFYKFSSLSNLEDLQQSFYNLLDGHKVKGTVLLAEEGINGTVAGSLKAIAAFKVYLGKQDLLSSSDFKLSLSKKEPFPRLKVKIKNEIVSIGNELANPQELVGEYVDPKDWNDLITQDDVLLIDTRNIYEYSIGSFHNSIQPETTNFREFPDWVEQLERSGISKDQKIAMFCTGGIRCEKSTAYMKEQGYEEVYHLEGGILKYLEEVPKEESLWEGECFVFDNRVSIKHGLEEGSYDQCYGCRWPITDDDKKSKNYIKGICCSRCFNNISKEKKTRSAERQKQIDLAEKRGRKHIAINIEEARNNSSKEKK